MLSRLHQRAFLLAALLNVSKKLTAANQLPFPFGEGVGDTETFPNDDSSSGVFILPSDMTFYGNQFDRVFQNTNGHVTFNAPYSSYTPHSFQATSSPL
mmetsp:Transcript_11838/g.26281  ORF Transcript_11838/g.26281 Transcript_11838/m.26281 type:complete len:98 (-) Transcript_11838:3322-3615(-)